VCYKKQQQEEEATSPQFSGEKFSAVSLCGITIFLNTFENMVPIQNATNFFHGVLLSRRVSRE
jgi:hypothetical protein